MAGSLGAYAEREMLDHFFGAAFTPPTNIYLGLWVGDPTDAGTGGAEVSGGSYARVLNNTWDAATTSGGKARSANTAAIAFPTATGSWGTPSHWALWDAITAGNLLWHGTIDSPVAVPSGDGYEFAAGALDLAWSGIFSDAVNLELMDHLMKVAAYTAPTEWWVGLSTADPGANGGSLAEPGGGVNYAREEVTAWDAAATAGGVSVVDNTPAVVFNTANGAGWGTISWLALFDAVAGTYLGRAQFTTARLIAAGNTPRIAAGNLDWIQE